MGTRRKLTTALAAATLALAGAAGCGGDDETTSVPAPDPEGATGASGEAQKDAEKPASAANEEGSGTGLEEDISGADSDGTDTEAGQAATTGDTTAE